VGTQLPAGNGSIPDFQEAAMHKALFVCTSNACRSQMAEGLLRHLGKGRFAVFSAGTHPKPIHPLAVRAMREIGIDISAQTSKSLDQYLGDRFDLIITVCDRAHQHGPVFPGDVERIHWGFDDPAEAAGTEEERMAVFRRILDEIQVRIRLLLCLGKYAE
jgi:arsenate reductase